MADRFHLLQNLRQTIEQQLSRVQRPIARSFPRSADSDVTTSPTVTRGRSVDLEVAEHCQLAREGRRRLRLDMFDRVKSLQAAGKSLSAIVHKTGFHWRTVAKWARLDALPERNLMAPKPTTPAAFQDNRLKTLKRAMYGRPGVELLRARVLPFQPSSEHAM